MPCGMAIERTLRELENLPSFGDNVFVVDASSYFNRPGPRVIRGAEILSDLFCGNPADPAEAVRVDAPGT